MAKDLEFDEINARLEYAKLNRRHFIVTKSTANMRFILPFFGWHVMFWVSRNPAVRTLGISNITIDGCFVPFLDYDNVFYYRVREEARRLQKDFDLGTLVTIVSKASFDNQGKEYGNYHVMGVAKLESLWKHKDMLERSSVDEQFKRVQEFFNGRYWVLRVLPKVGADGKKLRDRPVLREILSASTNRELSTAHQLFIEKYYHVPRFEFMGRQDGNTILKIVSYGTTEGRWKQDFLQRIGLR
jgi:hypothetical protein